MLLSLLLAHRVFFVLAYLGLVEQFVAVADRGNVLGVVVDFGIKILTFLDQVECQLLHVTLL